MSNPKNIDRLFQEKLQHFEQQPRPEVWSQIESRMHKKKKRRIVAWWWYAGAAAILLISLFVLLPKDPSNENIITDPVITNTPNTLDVQDTLKKNTPSKPFSNPTVIDDTETLITETKKEKQEHIQPSTRKQTPYKNIAPKEVIAENTTIEKQDQPSKNVDSSVDKEDKKIITSTIVDPQKKQEQTKKVEEKPLIDISKQVDSLQEKSITETKKKLFANLEEEILEDEEKDSKWSLRPLVAVSSMVGTSASSPTDQIFSNNPTSGNTAFNYGISVSYQVNDKLSFRTGVLTQNVNFDTERVTLSTSSGIVNDFSSINSTGNLSFILSGSNGDVAALSDGNSNFNIVETDAALNQTISYVEIPFELTYRLSKSKRLNTSFIGGFSSLFLNQNEIILRSNTLGNTTIGTASNLNSVNFSGNIGLDLDYQLYKKLFFNVNPMIKVHLNTFSRDQNGYIPVFIGVYSGLKYQF